MSRDTYERDEVLALSLLSALSGESIFLLGLPGVGKSMVARRLKLAFLDARVFEYLMSRFSTPDEIFGPVSISRLKDNDSYERITSGYLPESEIAFLDEIWKAGPAIQNALLTVLNERIYLNGNQEMLLPLRCVIAASNELPAKDEGLEALWDRFLLRYIVEPISGKENFIKLLSAGSEQPATPCADAFSVTDCRQILSESCNINIPDRTMEAIWAMREKLDAIMHRRDAVSGRPDPENVKFYISDRRWKKAIGVLRVSARLNDRDEVDLSDALLLSHMLWNDDTTIPAIRDIICEQVALVLFKEVVKNQENPRRHVKSSSKSAGNNGLYSPDGEHYAVQCEGTPMYIRIGDYKRIISSPREIFFASEDNQGVLRLLDMGQYTVCAGKTGHLCINSFDYPLKTIGESEMDRGAMDDMAMHMERLTKELNSLIDDNLFVRDSEVAKTMQRVMMDFRKRLEEA